MTIELLIRAIVRQTTILIAQLATSGGTRAPLSRVADQVFLELVRELSRQGVSRKVSADMFGLGLRTYQRKIQRLIESSSRQGRSLWLSILDALRSQGPTTRAELLQQFAGDDEALVRGVLFDLCETGLVRVTGAHAATTYQCTTEEEQARLPQSRLPGGLDELLWALIYREGPLDLAALAGEEGGQDEIRAALDRLVDAGRIEWSSHDGTYSACSLVVPLGSPVGWEASVFDHFKAMVNTITCRLRTDRASASARDQIGGSTYTLEVWPGHPLEAETLATLSTLRTKVGDLRQRIELHNAGHSMPENYTKVLVYVGQCLIPQGNTEPYAQE